ncbi:hypothetical protein MMC09_001361 [Bachmanniomyces sp. S44760]|nr:hypothetical protein [Bachmanniomyces sp. S44760]
MTTAVKDQTERDWHPTTSSDEEFDIFNGENMTATGASSPFIKDEPEEFNFNSMSFPNQQGFNMQMNHNYGQGGVDPSELLMQNNNFAPFGSQPNMSSSFVMGNSGIGDDELLDLDLNDTSKQNPFHQQGMGHQDAHNLFEQGHQINSGNQAQMNQIFSNTPDGAPIQSPFIHGNFNYAQFMPASGQQFSSHASPHMRPASGIQPGSMDNNYISARPRTSVSHGMDRKTSDSRSPMTPRTPGLAALNIGGTPESGSLPSQPIHTGNMNHRHQKTLSNQWDSTSGSLHSYVDSPISSPSQAQTAQISEILKSGKHASLPAKVETGHHGAPYQTQEAKRRRRRESHNMVERRRRDNINERIQELSHLVPMHRLEDEKVRKHLNNNSPLSPTLAATGMSPPQATSLLAAGGRRATGAGNITMGIPIEEKDKGPNKGDILNGAVGWTRDLMWALHVKLQQEEQLAELIRSLGGTFPFQESEDDKRMRSEIIDALEKNDPSSFAYTRAPGTGLRVPKHTNLAGESLGGTLSPQSLSPGQASGGSGGGGQQGGQPQFWNSGHRGSVTFKEEDEYGMEM